MNSLGEGEIIDDSWDAEITSKLILAVNDRNEAEIEDKLNEIIGESKGVLSDFYIFGQQTRQKGKYALRRKNGYIPSREDKAIFLGGI